MIPVCFFRSSSYNAYDFCQMQYYLRYTLGLPDKSNRAAIKGTIVHKALELLARQKLAIQESKMTFKDDELGDFFVELMHPDLAIKLSYDYFTEREEFDWKAADRRDCQLWFKDTIDYNDGQFNPLNLNVVTPEKYFEFEIAEPWAEYNYTFDNGTRLSGYLGLKGTLDLVTKIDENTYEYIDWKTGQRKDWNTGLEKTYAKLCDDPQLRLYHYAATRLYPKIKQIIITIFYSKDGGPFSMCFDESDLTKTMDMVKTRFTQIKNATRIQRIFPNWKCSKLCHYGKNNYEGSDKTICQYIKDEIYQLGLSKVTSNRCSPQVLLGKNYEGGGRYEASVN